MSPKTDKKVQVRAFVDADVRQAFKMACAGRGKTMDAVISEFIEDYNAKFQEELRKND
jgi:hypothetical protein